MKKKLKTIGAASLSFAMVASMLPNVYGKAAADYEFDNRYTIGWDKGIVAFENGSTSSTPIANSGVEIHNKQDDNIFRNEIEQAWDADKIILTKPAQFTTMVRYMILRVCLQDLIS